MNIGIEATDSTVAKQLDEEITIRRFVRFQVGEAA
jgi:hypothetical protein